MASSLRSTVRVITVAFLVQATLAHGDDTRCPFDALAVVPREVAVDQAKCLLRPVKTYGNLGEKLEELPPPLSQLVGAPVRITKAEVRKVLAERKIAESEIGGSLDERLSRANNDDPESETAGYFVIHDTSTPNFMDKSFPDDINTAHWPFNDLSKYGALAHVFINRVGQSATKVDFHMPFRATKFEMQVLGTKSKGRFLHIELVQPRRRDPLGGAKNDALSPSTGFTAVQMDRLALVYMAASVRAGRWLVPAFHAVLDAGLTDAHDDPQGFDLSVWSNCLQKLLKSISVSAAGHGRAKLEASSSPKVPGG